jgi:hypothetical protein
MTPRTFWSIILLSLIFPAQEIWQVWRYDDRNVNWWVALDYPLSVQWYFKFLGSKVSELLKALVIYRITFKIQALRMAATVVLIYTLVDLMLYFYNFNRAPYALILSTVALVSCFVFCWRITRTYLAHFYHKIIYKQHNHA